MKVYCVFECSGTPIADHLIEIFKHKEDAEFFAIENDFYVEEMELIEGRLQ